MKRIWQKHAWFLANLTQLEPDVGLKLALIWGCIANPKSETKYVQMRKDWRRGKN